jgi:hypothetical protein
VAQAFTAGINNSANNSPPDDAQRDDSAPRNRTPNRMALHGQAKPLKKMLN